MSTPIHLALGLALGAAACDSVPPPSFDGAEVRDATTRPPSDADARDVIEVVDAADTSDTRAPDVVFRVPTDCPECAPTTPDGHTPLNTIINDPAANIQLLTSWFEWSPSATCLELRLRNMGSAAVVTSFTVTLDVKLTELTRPSDNATVTWDGSTVTLAPHGKDAKLGPTEFEFFSFCASPVARPVGLEAHGYAPLVGEDGQPVDISVWQDPLSIVEAGDVSIVSYLHEVWATGGCTELQIHNAGDALGPWRFDIQLDKPVTRWSSLSDGVSHVGSDALVILGTSLPNGDGLVHLSCTEPTTWPTSLVVSPR